MAWSGHAASGSGSSVASALWRIVTRKSRGQGGGSWKEDWKIWKQCTSFSSQKPQRSKQRQAKDAKDAETKAALEEVMKENCEQGQVEDDSVRIRLDKAFDHAAGQDARKQSAPIRRSRRDS